jgi:hypothetical protein
MKLISMALIALNCILLVNPVKAQSVESIWISTSTNSFITGETVIVSVNGASATPIQGFTFQLGYDPACLKPISVTSPVLSMNSLSLPQLDGLVDESFMSTTPQFVNSVLADVRFITLGACQTNVELRSAAFIVTDGSGYSAPLPGVEFSKEGIVITIREDKGASLLTGIAIVIALIVVISLFGILLLIYILRRKNSRA